MRKKGKEKRNDEKAHLYPVSGTFAAGHIPGGGGV